MMAEDWKPGDLARCVRSCDDAAFPSGCAGAPIVGLTYTVSRVFIGVDLELKRQLGLAFVEIRRGFSPTMGWRAVGYTASNFRKVRPIDADDFDREVIEALRCAPAVAG